MQVLCNCMVDWLYVHVDSGTLKYFDSNRLCQCITIRLYVTITRLSSFISHFGINGWLPAFWKYTYKVGVLPVFVIAVNQQNCENATYVSSARGAQTNLKSCSVDLCAYCRCSSSKHKRTELNLKQATTHFVQFCLESHMVTHIDQRLN